MPLSAFTVKSTLASLVTAVLDVAIVSIRLLKASFGTLTTGEAEEAGTLVSFSVDFLSSLTPVLVEADSLVLFSLVA